MALREQYRPDVQIMSSMARSLQTASSVSSELKVQATNLTTAAQPYLRDGNTAEARKRLAQAVCILLGRDWNAREEYSASLVLRTDMTVADLSRPWVGQIAQRYPVRLNVSGLRMRVSLAQGQIPSRSDTVVETGKILEEVGTFDLASRDLTDEPYRFDIVPARLKEGAYIVVAEVLDDNLPIGRLVTPVYFVRDLGARQAAIEKLVAKIDGHEGTKATALYPFDLARGINTGRRDVNGFDWPVEIQRAEEIAQALASGIDPLYQAKGDNRRNYRFTEAGEIMPYRVFVPSKWNGTAKLPTILALHGANLDENNMLTRDNNAMQKLAEQHGYIVAAPLGYRINGAYGNRGMAGGPGAVLDATLLRQTELSEEDVLNVLELVAEEYHVDRSRIYLMGNSMGGAGTYYIGSKYPEKFAALAPCAAGIGAPGSDEPPAFPFDRLKGVPLMTVVGDLDGGMAGVRSTVKMLKEHGLEPQYVEVKGGTHGTAIQIAMPQIFDFFDAHSRRADR